MNFLGIKEIRELVKVHQITAFYRDLIEYLEQDFKNWDTFEHRPRVSSHVPGGVLELMPTCNGQLYSFKYVNGHPKNTASGKLSIFGMGALVEADTGLPMLFSEMTLLTAFRTAATAALAAKIFAKDARKVALIGCGAQGEFLAFAHAVALKNFQEMTYFDVDVKAMERFSKNIRSAGLEGELRQARNVRDTLAGAEVLITATAKKAKVEVVKDSWITEPIHINGLGGDCPDKTELPPSLVKRAHVFTEYLPQTRMEGEIQNLPKDQQDKTIELHRILRGEVKIPKGRLTLFDCVGFALEDFSILRLCRDLAERYQLGLSLDLIPKPKDPKNLFGLLNESTLK